MVTVSTLMLTAGTAILRWLAESIEAQGLGDGISLLITLSIVTSEPPLSLAYPKGYLDMGSILKQVALSLATSELSVSLAYPKGYLLCYIIFEKSCPQH